MRFRAPVSNTSTSDVRSESQISRARGGQAAAPDAGARPAFRRPERRIRAVRRRRDSGATGCAPRSRRSVSLTSKPDMRTATVASAPSAKPGAATRPTGVSTMPSLHARRETIEFGEEAGGKQVDRPEVEVLGAAGLHQRAVPEQRDAVAHAHRLLRVMRDDDGGGAAFAQDGQRLGAHGVLEARSRPENGSSIRRTAGRGASARASATRCCSPPDRTCG